MATRFGPYRLLRRIAAGGMGEVYLAVLEREGGFEKTVALKTMLPTVENSEAFAELFESEAKVAAMLNHANIVHIFDHGIIEGRSYLTMELVEGPDLGSLLETVGADGFPPSVVSEIGVQLCRGLGHAHERRDLRGRPAGIVHGDVSPSNVLISQDGQAKLADFGLARVRDVFSSKGSVTGKYPYMSPEQAQGQPLTPKSDLFSLGLVLYEMFTGLRAFPLGENPEKTLVAIRKHDLVPAGTCRPDLPQAIRDFLDRALAPSARDRFDSAGSMARTLNSAYSSCGPERLSEFIRPHAASSESPDPVSPEPTELAQKPVSPQGSAPTRTPYYALLVLFVVAWGAGLLWWALHTPTPTPKPASPKAEKSSILEPPAKPPEEPVVAEPAQPKAPMPRRPRPVQIPSALALEVQQEFELALDHRPQEGKRIEIKKPAPHLIRLRPRQGKSPEVSMRLTPSGKPDGSWKAALRATPWMKISLDKRPEGQTPRSNLLLPPGRSRLVLTRGEQTVSLVLDIRKPSQ